MKVCQKLSVIIPMMQVPSLFASTIPRVTVQIEPLRLPINCRERTKKAFCPIVALPPSDGGDDGPQGRREMFVVDPRLVYRMPSGKNGY